MRFQVLSHAGLRVQAGATELLCDPWIVGSCYWRSWWNYPPVRSALIADLKPTAIYLTHIHWDHFQGPSLRRFDRSTPVYVPKGHHDRLRRDLEDVGFHDVRELLHGQTVELSPGVKLTSWQFFPFLDSAVVIEADGVTLLNANDAKLMGAPLDQVLARHGTPDFVFRSHSSANGRLCYEVVDAPEVPVDDDTSYVRSFAAFVQRTGARYAVPFASNHCFLHPDVYPLNHTVTTPLAVRDHMAGLGVARPEVKVMVSGDAWSSDGGFALQPDTDAWFTDRPARLEAYKARVQPTLDAFVATEARTRVTEAFVDRWAQRFAAALPWAVRWAWRDHPVTFVLASGEQTHRFQVDLHLGRAREVAQPDPSLPLLEVHTTAFIFKQCVSLDLFSHLQISKRVRFRVTTDTVSRMKLLNFLFELWDYDYLPVSDIDWLRQVETWSLRWREVGLYARILGDVARGRGIDQLRYLEGPDAGRG